MHLTKNDIQALDRVKRLNIINSISGIKPANLIGSVSYTGQTNLAIFSSVFHLGSNPALMGMICRPSGEVPRHTLENIKETKEYTINAITELMTQRAHYTSAKFDRSLSEFDACDIEAEYIKEMKSPLVKDSPLKMGLSLKEIIPIKVNDTIMIVGEVKHLFVDDDLMSEEGYLDLAKARIAGIGGLNNYYHLEKVATYPYARTSDMPKWS